MSITLKRPAPAPRGPGAPATASPASGQPVVQWPQADLLPPEIRAGWRLRRVKAWMVVLVLASLVVVAAGYALAWTGRRAAETELAGVQAETRALQAEQRGFAEVPRVQGRLADVRDARTAGMATEVLWAEYLEALRAVTPEGVSYDALTVLTATPGVAGPVSADPLVAPGVGSISFTARSVTVPDLAAWMDALDGVPGFADARLASASRTADDGGTAYFQITGDVQVTADAFALRYLPTEEE